MKKLFPILFIALVSVALLSSTARAQVTLVAWNFPNNPDDATADGGIAANLSATISCTATGTLAFTAAGATTSAATDTKWTTGSYWQVNFTTTGYTGINVSSKQKGSGTGPRDFQLQYSTDGSSFNNVTGGAITDTNDAFVKGVLTNVSLPAACNNQTTVYLRWTVTDNVSVAGATIGTGGTSRIDDIYIVGYAPVSDGNGTATLTNSFGSGNLNGTLVFPTNTSAQSVKLHVTGAPAAAGTLTQVSVTVPYQWGWTGSGSDVAPSGDDAAGLNSQAVTGSGTSGDPYVVTYSGSITNTSIASITFSNLTSANPTNITDNGNYVFIVSTKASGTLTAIAASPTAYVVIPLANIRNQTSGVPVLNGVTVATKAIGTVASGVFSTSQLQSYIQDGSVGVNLFINGAGATVTEGDEYIVKGLVNQFLGNTELQPTSNADVIDMGASTMPAFQVVTAAQLSASPETYEGTYVAVQHLSLTAGSWPTASTDSTLTMNDGTDLRVTIKGTTDIHTLADPTSGGTVMIDVAGIFTQTANTPAYALLPRHKAIDIGPNNTLPVELTSFTALAGKSGIELAWSTATEINNSGFAVERKTASSPYSQVAFVAGNGTSNTAHQYTYTDAVSAGTYTYRLKQVDHDGKFTYSKEIEAAVKLAPQDYALSQNYPNPFNPTTVMTFAVKTDQHASMKVYNMLGQEVMTLFDGVAKADQLNRVQFNASGLSSGTYFTILQTGDTRQIKKMVLLK